MDHDIGISPDAGLRDWVASEEVDNTSGGPGTCEATGDMATICPT